MYFDFIQNIMIPTIPKILYIFDLPRSEIPMNQVNTHYICIKTPMLIPDDQKRTKNHPQNLEQSWKNTSETHKILDV